jgi:hypothetical protein
VSPGPHASAWHRPAGVAPAPRGLTDRQVVDPWKRVGSRQRTGRQRSLTGGFPRALEQSNWFAGWLGWPCLARHIGGVLAPRQERAGAWPETPNARRRARADPLAGVVYTARGAGAARNAVSAPCSRGDGIRGYSRSVVRVHGRHAGGVRTSGPGEYVLREQGRGRGRCFCA